MSSSHFLNSPFFLFSSTCSFFIPVHFLTVLVPLLVLLKVWCKPSAKPRQREREVQFLHWINNQLRVAKAASVVPKGRSPSVRMWPSRLKPTELKKKGSQWPKDNCLEHIYFKSLPKTQCFFALVSLIMDIVSLKTFTKGQISNRIESKCLKINHKMSFDINAIEANYFYFRCEYFQLFELSYSNYCYQNVWTFEEWNFSITELLDYWTYWKLNLLKTELLDDWTSR